MLQGTDREVADEYEFGYFPEQSVSVEQRLEIVEAQLAELRQQFDSVLELLYDGRTPTNCGNPWD
jgi:hypothetical protein